LIEAEKREKRNEKREMEVRSERRIDRLSFLIPVFSFLLG
jgi:hypothetical protein